MDSKLIEELRDLIRAGRKIEAIKRLREATGVGLAEAKATLDGLESSPAASVPTRSAPARQHGMPARAQGLLHQGRKIDAIKALREARGLGLKDAHDQIKAYLDDHPELRRLNQGSPIKGLGIVVALALGLAAWLLLR